MHPLDGASMRVLRAERHIDEAEMLIRDFDRAYEQRIVFERNERTGEYMPVNQPELPDLSPELPLAVSDAVHNLRAALDYLVYELARYDAKKIVDGTQFLIEDVKADPAKPTRGFDARKKKCLCGLNGKHIDAIEALQPYK